MAKDFNQIIIVGRLTKDPEVRYTGNKVKHVKFTIANSDDYKQGDTKVDRTYFINCEAYGATGDIIEKYAFKGKQVLINGKMYVREVEKEGNRTWYSGIVVQSIQLLGGEKRTDQVKIIKDTPAPEALDIDEAGQVEIPF